MGDPRQRGPGGGGESRAGSRLEPAELEALARGRHRDPFSVLGPHRDGGSRQVRCVAPGASAVTLLDRNDRPVGELDRVHEGGVFEGPMPPRLRRYRLRVVEGDGHRHDLEDPYRFPSTLGEVDRYLLAEGSHQRIYETLGAHLMALSGVTGTRFAVWAPNASRVSVVGDFNRWDGRRHVMRLHPANGIWEIFLPGVGEGTLYKFELLDARGERLPLKTDPVARFCEAPGGNAAIVYRSRYRWGDDDWQDQRRGRTGLAEPMAIYEVHLGSWRRQDDGGWLGYRELAETLVEHVTRLGFTHVELLPVSEHPFDGSWGYQPIGLYAPTHRFGEPDDFRYLVDRCHQAGIAVILDWVPAHFPKDAHGLARFDGTALYEHADPRKGEHQDWGTLIYNLGRREVVNYLVGSALSWIREFHIDGLRVDAVASMLYLDYSRDEGQWVPNPHGGNENLEAVAFLKHLNTVVHGENAITFAEESTAWPAVSRPVESGGLGFTYKWNMGWMNDTLAYVSEDPLHRRYHHDRVTFGPVYAFTENFVLPLSHDEVVHGKRSLIGRMPGDHWKRCANLRAYYGFMYGHPGKKLLFMGAEFAQEAEWNHDRALDWHLLDEDPLRAGIEKLLIELNRFYRATAALFEVDFESPGFEWIDWQDRENSVLSWLRRGRDGDFVVCLTNFTPVVRESYRIGVPREGRYRECLNTDHPDFGGSGVLNAGELQARPEACHGRPFSLTLRLPPLATVFLVHAE